MLEVIQLISLLLLVMNLGTSLEVSPPLEPPLEKADPEWCDGPVRYLLTSGETTEYRRLQTESERDEFIRKFWRSLDAQSGSAADERRREFWKRVAVANSLFREPILPGWRTDRGRTHIVVGAPNEVEIQGEGETWTYYSLPLRDWPFESRVSFKSGVGGVTKFLRSNSSGSRGISSQPRIPKAEDGVLRLLDSGDPQLIPGRFVMVDSSVKADYFFPALNPASDYRTYRGQGGRTLVILDIVLPGNQLDVKDSLGSQPVISLVGTIVGAKGGDTLRLALPVTVSFEPSKGIRVPRKCQAVFELGPGVHSGDFTIVERKSHYGASFHREFLVPDYAQGLKMSSLTLSRKPATQENVRTDSLVFAWYSQGTSTFSSGDTLYLSSQVYNAKSTVSNVDLRVSYRFSRRIPGAEEQVIHESTQDHVERASLRYSRPLAGWSEGSYRVQVQVIDNLSGASTSGALDFQVSAREGR